MYCGVGTHYIPSKDVQQIQRELCEGDISTSHKIEVILARYAKAPVKDATCVLFDNRHAMDRCFSAQSVEGIIQNLEKEDSIWAKETLRILDHNCPTSLKVTFEALKRAKDMTFEEAINMELRVGTRLVARKDIQEGVNSVLVVKDRTVRPRWHPAHLRDVLHEEVMSYFRPFDDVSMNLPF